MPLAAGGRRLAAEAIDAHIGELVSVEEGGGPHATSA
jgi:hypothetical protein